MTNQQDNGGIVVAEARPAHVPAIAGVISAAFGSQAEARLVEALRAEGAVVAELVVLESGRVAGAAMFSRLEVLPANRRMAALAPIAVLPGWQGVGIGGMLIRAGLEHCRASGIEVVTVLGNPAYYSRFGFAGAAAGPLECAYSGPDFMAMTLRAGALDGGRWTLTYPRAFALV